MNSFNDEYFDSKIQEKIDQKFGKMLATVKETNNRLDKVEKVVESLACNMNSMMKFFKHVYPSSKIFKNSLNYGYGKHTPKKVFKFWKKGDRKSQIFSGEEKIEANRENLETNYGIKLEEGTVKVKIEEGTQVKIKEENKGRSRKRIGIKVKSRTVTMKREIKKEEHNYFKREDAVDKGMIQYLGKRVAKLLEE
jgi:hypothetical protein